MPKRRKRSEQAADASGEDLLGALPDDVLQVVLSLLPSGETVRTCVLSRRWRHLWKSTPVLRVIRDGEREWSAWKLNNVVNHLLLLRDCLPVDECEFCCNQFVNENEDELFRFADGWIRRAVSLFQARVLKVCIRMEYYYLPLLNMPLISQLLMRVEFCHAILQFRSLDFSSCPALEDLKMRSCTIYADKIISQSLRRLHITRCYFELNSRTCISPPCVVSLQLADITGRAPSLESMPLVGNSICQVWCRL